MGLIFYHGWKKSEVAELMGVKCAPCSGAWESALARLHHRLKERRPGDAT